MSLSFHGIYEFLQEYLVYCKIENKHCCLETINKTQGGGVVRGRVSKEEVADTQASASYTVQLALNHKFGFEFPDDQIKKINTIY